MSIFCTNVDAKSPLLKKCQLYGAKEFIWAKALPFSCPCQFPSDYKFTKCFLPKKYTKLSDRIRNFAVRSDDIWICAFPKSGSTWLANICWQLQNNLDFTKNLPVLPYAFIERPIFFDTCGTNKGDKIYQAGIDRIDKFFEDCEKQPSPRLLKSHLPASLLPSEIWTKKPKLIYVHRDVRDVAISMYHMFRNHLWIKYPGTMEDFFDLFLNDHIYYGPFHEHINSFRQLHQCDHILFISYEEMVASPFATIKKISEFLNYSYSDVQLKQLMEHLSFENMRRNFIRPAIYAKDYRYEPYLLNIFTVVYTIIICIQLYIYFNFIFAFFQFLPQRKIVRIS